MPDRQLSMTVQDLSHGWTPRRIGRTIELYPEVTSTNAVALTLAEQPEADGRVVLADFQTGGRGRQGNTWQSPRGAGILCSILLVHDPAATGKTNLKLLLAEDSGAAPDAATIISGRLTLIAAVAACDAVRACTDITPAIKWPNDLRVDRRKLGGILIESRLLADERRAWTIGIGINCLQQAGHFPPELAGKATSLEMLSTEPIDRTAVTRALLQQLDHWLGRSDWPSDARIHQAWMNYAEPLGQRVHLQYHDREYTGRTIAVDPSGGLIVQTDQGRPEWFAPMYTQLL